MTIRLRLGLARSNARIGLVCAALLSACGGDDAASKQWPLSHSELAGGKGATEPPGAATYDRYCIGCHGADGRGNGGLTGADLTGLQSPLASRSDTELQASVRDGKRGASATMPAHSPILNDAQIAAVIGYLRQRFQNK